MGLDPETAALMAKLQDLGGGGTHDLGEADVAGMRAASRAMWQELNGPDVEGCTVTAISLAGPRGAVPARLYRPANAAGHALPLVVFFHGGGWALGDLDGYQTLVKALCVSSGAGFLSVDYRLSPEHPFPAGLEDCLAAVRWAAAQAASLNIDPARIGVMGDSAGGNLAAVIAQMLRDDPAVKPAAQFLIYPMLDVASSHDAFASRRDHGNAGYVISVRDIEVTTAWYLPDVALARDPRVSPLLAPDVRGLAPAVIVAAGFDPLMDEARQYAGRLRAAGVPLRYRCFDTTVHAFLSFGGLAVAQEGRAWLAAQVQALLGPPDTHA